MAIQIGSALVPIWEPRGPREPCQMKTSLKRVAKQYEYHRFRVAKFVVAGLLGSNLSALEGVGNILFAGALNHYKITGLSGHYVCMCVYN
jgi:hypothetical protein